MGELLESLNRSETAKEKWRNSPEGTRVLLGHEISERIDQMVTEAGKAHVPTNKGAELVLMIIGSMLRSTDPETSSKAQRALGINNQPDR